MYSSYIGLAAAHNLSVHAFSSIGNIWKNFVESLVYKPIEALFTLSFWDLKGFKLSKQIHLSEHL